MYPTTEKAFYAQSLLNNSCAHGSCILNTVGTFFTGNALSEEWHWIYNISNVRTCESRTGFINTFVDGVYYFSLFYTLKDLYLYMTLQEYLSAIIYRLTTTISYASWQLVFAWIEWTLKLYLDDMITTIMPAPRSHEHSTLLASTSTLLYHTTHTIQLLSVHSNVILTAPTTTQHIVLSQLKSRIFNTSLLRLMLLASPKILPYLKPPELPPP